MAAYVLVNINVADPDGFKQYQTPFPALMAPSGGKYLVRGGRVERKESAWLRHRMILMEFPNLGTPAGCAGSMATRGVFQRLMTSKGEAGAQKPPGEAHNHDTENTHRGTYRPTERFGEDRHRRNQGRIRGTATAVPDSRRQPG
jgi:uncharacterized protein (DUF1330 family)